MPHQDEEIKEFFEGDFNGLIKSCRPLSKMFTTKISSWSLIPSAILVIVLIFSKASNVVLFSLLKDLVNNGLTIVGILIGLSLGGFILIVSYGTQSLIEKSAEIQAKKYLETNVLKYSYIQRSIGKYGLITLFQFIIFITLILFFITLKLDLQASGLTPIVMNLIAIFLTSSLLLYSLALTFVLILNIFTLSQSSNLQIFMSKKNELEDNLPL